MDNGLKNYLYEVLQREATLIILIKVENDLRSRINSIDTNTFRSISPPTFNAESYEKKCQDLKLTIANLESYIEKSAISFYSVSNSCPFSPSYPSYETEKKKHLYWNPIATIRYNRYSNFSSSKFGKLLRFISKNMYCNLQKKLYQHYEEANEKSKIFRAWEAYKHNEFELKPYRESLNNAKRQLEITNGSHKMFYDIYLDKKIRYEKDYEKAKILGEQRTQLANLLKSKRDIVNKLVAQTRNCINKLYNYNIIHSKYRNNLSIISSLYDYVDSDRTNSLNGSGWNGGAYHLYEEDVKHNRVINVMSLGFDKISSQLSAIQRNQNALYQAIQQGNSIFNDISAQLNNISNAISRGTDLLQQGNASLSEIPYFMKESNINSRILVDIERDRWGNLRNRDGILI